MPPDTLMPTPSGVGQPRSEWTIERKAASVLPTAYQPWAVTINPIGKPSR